MPHHAPLVRRRARSLRGRLIVLWIISLATAFAAGTVLLQLYQQSSIDQVARADAVGARACDEIGDRYRFYVSGWSRPPADLHDTALQSGLRIVAIVALARFPGIEGGVWQRDAGPLAYAFPTYEGTGPKTDLPAAELDSIRAINADALADDRPAGLRQAGRQQTLLMHACPLPGPIAGVTAWTMTRVFNGQGAGYARLLGGLGVLLASVLASAVWTTHLLLTWSRKLGAIEAAVAGHDGPDPPVLPPTGEQELDRIVRSLNAAGAKLAAMRVEAERLSAQAAAAGRLAALGRVAAGIAHEICNPIAAMRLKAENALLGDDARRRAALDMMLGQIARLDGLLRDLLTLTHTFAPPRQLVDVPALLTATVELHREMAEQRGVRLTVAGTSATGTGIIWPLDPSSIRRALDNLVLNAMQAMPGGGAIVLSAEVEGDLLRLRVSDDGPGLPDAVRRNLFEPFVTGRADGTGLGLSIVREIAAAHGGTVECRPGIPGTFFTLSLPHPETA